MIKEKESNPTYFAVIPADVRYSDIPPNAKLLYGEITALCNKEGFCWASNRYFSELYGKSTSTISVWISHLVKNGFVNIEVIDCNSRKIFLKGVLEKSKGGIRKIERGVLEKSKHNSTINKTKNKTTKKAIGDFQENSRVEVEKDQTDIFKNVVGLKKKIGPKQYGLLNKVAQDENIYDLLRNEFYLDGRFEILMNYLEYRKGKRKGYNGTIGMKAIIKLFTEFESIELYDALTKTITNQWQSINPTKNIAQRRLERLRKENTSQLNNYFPTLQQKRAI